MLLWTECLCSRVEILAPSGMVLGDGAFERWLGQEGRALTNGISALMKETLDSYLVLSAMWGYDEKTAIYNLKEDSYQTLPGGTVISDSQPPELWEINCFCF